MRFARLVGLSAIEKIAFPRKISLFLKAAHWPLTLFGSRNVVSSFLLLFLRRIQYDDSPSEGWFYEASEHSSDLCTRFVRLLRRYGARDRSAA
jgi:hypothetical protein